MRIEVGKRYRMKNKKYAIVEVQSIDEKRVTYFNVRGPRTRYTKSLLEFKMKFEEK